MWLNCYIICAVHPPSCSFRESVDIPSHRRLLGKAEQYGAQETTPWEEGLAFTSWGGGSSFMIAFSHRQSRLPWQESTILIEAGRDWLECGHSWKPPRARTLNRPQTPRSSSRHLPLAVAIPSSPLFSLGRIAPSNNELLSRARELCLWCKVVARVVLASNLKFYTEIQMPQPARTEASGRKIKPEIAFIYKP